MQEQPEFNFFEQQPQESSARTESEDVAFFKTYLQIALKPDQKDTSGTTRAFFEKLLPHYDALAAHLSEEERIQFSTLAERVASTLLNETDNLLLLLRAITNNRSSFKKHFVILKEKMDKIETLANMDNLTVEQIQKKEQQKKLMNNLEIETMLKEAA